MGGSYALKRRAVCSKRSEYTILTAIKLSKQSLMVEYIKSMMQKFDWQLHLRTINEELETMFQMMNADLSRLGDLELTYAVSDLWNMIQKSDVTGVNQTLLEEKENYEILIIFLNLLEEVMMINPKKMLILLENIDHWVSGAEYRNIIEKIENIVKKYDVYFILTTSIDGYAVCNKELCAGIHIVGDVQFQMPEFEKILNYVNGIYPCNKKLSIQEIEKDLVKIIQKIGRMDYLYTIEENVICKLINETLLLKEKWPDTENLLEIAFLKS